MGIAILTRKQALALEDTIRLHRLQHNKDGKSSIVSKHAIMELEGRRGWGTVCEPLNDLSLDTLTAALYVGYKVEMTQEEREGAVRDYYRDQKSQFVENRQSSHDAILGTLELLGIQIKGVNA